MRPVRSLWLAGPESWLPDSEAQAARQRALCLEAGLEAIVPARLPPGEAAITRVLRPLGFELALVTDDVGAAHARALQAGAINAPESGR